MSMDNALYNIMDNTSTISIRTNPSACRACNFISGFASIWSGVSIPKSTIPKPALFSEKYTLGQKLGAGTYSTVREGIHLEQNITYAIKIIPKVSLSREDKYALKSEVEILHSISHPNIIKLYAVYREPRFYYLVTEYMNGGELFERIVSKTKYKENETIKITRILLDAIGYCHDHNIVHRDIKPENLLLCRRDDDIQIKISDFGFAKRVTSEACLTTRCGSPNYVAPEIIARTPYGKPVDCWSIGVVIYILLCGYLPFADKSHVVLYRKIKQVRYQFHNNHWSEISKDAKDFITMLLVREPSQRLPARHALSHWWLRPRLEEQECLKNAIKNSEPIKIHTAKIEDDDRPVLSDNLSDNVSKEKAKSINSNPASDYDNTEETSEISFDDDDDSNQTTSSDKDDLNRTKSKSMSEYVLVTQQNWGVSHVMSSCSKLNVQRKFLASAHAISRRDVSLQ